MGEGEGGVVWGGREGNEKSVLVVRVHVMYVVVVVVQQGLQRTRYAVCTAEKKP